MGQRKSEWINVLGDHQYHTSQFATPYRSTVAFVQWLCEKGVLTAESVGTFLDVGCGKGANLYYLARRFPGSRFQGIDINPTLVEEGNRIFQAEKVPNAALELCDLYAPNPSLEKRFDGVVSFQTLSWLPEFREPLQRMGTMSRKWVAVTSLFFEGDLNCTIMVEDHDRKQADGTPGQYYYNVYSLPLVARHLASCGFSKFSCLPFEIDIDLEKSHPRGIGTYTEKTVDGRRLQFSGPLHLPWYFILAERE